MADCNIETYQSEFDRLTNELSKLLTENRILMCQHTAFIEKVVTNNEKSPTDNDYQISLEIQKNLTLMNHIIARRALLSMMI